MSEKKPMPKCPYNVKQSISVTKTLIGQKDAVGCENRQSRKWKTRRGRTKEDDD